MCADNITLNAGASGATLAADDITSVWYQIVKLAFGALDTATLVTTTSGLPVQNVAALPAGTNNIGDVDVLTLPAITIAAAQTLTTVTTVSAVTAITNALPAGTNNIGDVDVLSIAAGDNNIGNVDIVTVPAPLNVTGGGVELGALRVTLANDSTGVVSVDDNAGALTVDWAGTAPPIGAGVEATALRVTVATDSTGVVSVDDNGASLTVDVGTALPAGTNNIGDVDVLSIAAGDNNIGNVDIASAIPAGTNLIGIVSVGHNTTTIYDGATALTPKFAIIDAATSGDNTLVAAVVGKKIRVLAAFVVSAGTVITRFESGAAGTALSGQMNLVANSGYTLPFNPCGWFETASNTLLNLELSAAISVDGSLVYVEV